MEPQSPHADELAALRRRAYGPDADIDADPDAQARLAELEHESARRGPSGSAGAATDAEPVSVRPGSISTSDAIVVPLPPDTASVRVTAGRMRGLTAFIAVGTSVLAVFALGPVVLDRLNQPQPVARLEPLDEVPRGTALPMIEPEQLRFWGVTDPDFVPHGEYGALDVWSTTGARGRQCLAVSVGGEVSGFHCTASTIDTVVDVLSLNSWVPQAPEGGRIPLESTIHFVLHEGVVEVYVGRNSPPERDGGDG